LLIKKLDSPELAEENIFQHIEVPCRLVVHTGKIP
jgi:hypothetical protein